MKRTTVSRRRLLASVPAVAAIAAPTAAAALSGLPASAEDNPDAELLRLGELMKPIAAEMKAAREADDAESTASRAKLKAAGLKEKDEYPDIHAWSEEYNRLSVELGIDGKDVDDDGWEVLHDEAYGLLDRILAIQPTTPDGLRVQVFAMISCDPELADDSIHNTETEAPFWRNLVRFYGLS